MDHIDQQLLEELNSNLAADLSINEEVQGLVAYLPACEYELILFMSQKGVWRGAVPPPPDGFSPGDGSIELGLYLHWIDNPGTLDLSAFSLDEQLAIRTVCALIKSMVASSQMTPANYGFFDTNHLIYVDGTVLGTERYENFDQTWFIAFLNLAESAIRWLWYNDGVFPTTPPPSPIVLTGASAGCVDIAILGDWGTGDAAAQEVMRQLTGLNPDYVVHVGDVYYGGTPSTTTPTGDKYWLPGEENDNLISVWPPTLAGKSFTLNSNHEMYSGGNGYFYDALGAANSPAGAGTVFSAQQGSSCFALTFEGWTMLCLDSAFMSSTTNAFMIGSIGGADGTQGRWIQSLNLDPARTIVLTHHNGFAEDCSSVSPLWAEIRSALGSDPYAWYWGHVHNGIVYDAPISIPADDSQPALSTSTYARCLGHAALPYGTASALAGKPIAWHADSQKPGSNLLLNGFAVLSLQSTGGQVTITERFYDPGSAEPKWSRQIYPRNAE